MFKTSHPLSSLERRLPGIVLASDALTISTQGAAVEVEADGEWWDAHVVEATEGR